MTANLMEFSRPVDVPRRRTCGVGRELMGDTVVGSATGYALGTGRPALELTAVPSRHAGTRLR